MSHELRDLYQELIIDHGRHPRNFGQLEPCSCQQEGFNPLCGDQLTVYLQINPKQIIEAIRFQGSGCAISMASASLMTEALLGQSTETAQKLFEQFHQMVMHDDSSCEVEKLNVLANIRDYPMRVKCATLAWHTLKAALDGDQTPATTE